jgi:hypothetical protein
LTRPHFTEDAFRATKFDTAADKAWFANALCRFIETDFKPTLFTRKLHTRLSMCFGHIAHHSLDGFSAEFFERLRGKVAFLEQTLGYPCRGDPEWTYCDVERAIQARLRACNLLPLYRARLASEVDSAERALLARLREKYDGVPVPPPPALPIARPAAPGSNRRREQEAVNQARLF